MEIVVFRLFRFLHKHREQTLMDVTNLDCIQQVWIQTNKNDHGSKEANREIVTNLNLIHACPSAMWKSKLISTRIKQNNVNAKITTEPRGSEMVFDIVLEYELEIVVCRVFRFLHNHREQRFTNVTNLEGFQTVCIQTNKQTVRATKKSNGETVTNVNLMCPCLLAM